jgi:hypothetical protein
VELAFTAGNRNDYKELPGFFPYDVTCKLKGDRPLKQLQDKNGGVRPVKVPAARAPRRGTPCSLPLRGSLCKARDSPHGALCADPRLGTCFARIAFRGVEAQGWRGGARAFGARGLGGGSPAGGAAGQAREA